GENYKSSLQGTRADNVAGDGGGQWNLAVNEVLKITKQGGNMNKKGYVMLGMPIGAVVALAIITAATGNGLYETYKNGVLKANGKKIWCQMQNKGKAVCLNPVQ
ncbi:MAG: hypothetical protein AAB706_01975, partial [Patescibacteria group bacterium]